MCTRIVPDSGSGKSGILLFYGNPAKSDSGQTCSRIQYSCSTFS